MSNIIIKPIITEKATANAEDLNQYGFLVSTAANKVEIKKAIESHYSVQVTSVNTMNYAGKRKRRSTKTAVVEGRTPSFKKAVITVAEGEIIDLYTGL